MLVLEDLPTQSQRIMSPGFTSCLLLGVAPVNEAALEHGHVVDFA